MANEDAIHHLIQTINQHRSHRRNGVANKLSVNRSIHHTNISI
ncbi:Uncharacterised protein [Vibrio cholerae]|nr:Uncharacterised protein [Vibrio cholerae]CSC60080.1 Uncharacterised protein [Vibrio cholerae]CSI31435.1 Uncharacterised protein [Vibrio cholerae]CSI79471.1 Uncharacterised protein [Vibrio cholerae]